MPLASGNSRSRTRIGDGQPASMVARSRTCWPGLEVIFQSDDISRPTDWRIREHRHAIVVHLAGKMDWLETELDGQGGSCGAALPGEVWSVPAGHRYASHACGGTISYAVILLQPDALDKMIGQRHGLRDIKPLAGTRDTVVHRLVLKLRAAAQENEDVACLMGEELSRTLSVHLFRTHGVGEPETTRKDCVPPLNGLLARSLREYVYDNIAKRITLEELSAVAGLTTHHLLIAFRRTFGTTPAQYVIAQRLRAAQRLLARSGKDITEIALESGFSSHSHLTATFTKAMGFPPREYQAQKSARRDFSR